MLFKNTIFSVFKKKTVFCFLFIKCIFLFFFFFGEQKTVFENSYEIEPFSSKNLATYPVLLCLGQVTEDLMFYSFSGFQSGFQTFFFLMNKETIY